MPVREYVEERRINELRIEHAQFRGVIPIGGQNLPGFSKMMREDQFAGSVAIKIVFGCVIGGF